MVRPFLYFFVLRKMNPCGNEAPQLIPHLHSFRNHGVASRCTFSIACCEVISNLVKSWGSVQVFRHPRKYSWGPKKLLRSGSDDLHDVSQLPFPKILSNWEMWSMVSLGVSCISCKCEDQRSCNNVWILSTSWIGNPCFFNYFWKVLVTSSMYTALVGYTVD